RSRTITIRHLLEHSAGFDRSISGDPFFQPLLAYVAARQRTAPITCEAIVRDSLQRRLDFTPGERFAYSNVGYCILGKIVEATSGRDFTAFVGQEILGPSTGKGFRAGKSIESAPGEASYYPYPGEPKSVAAPGIPGLFGVPSPYGSYSIESMEALGAWICTPTDVLRFMLSIDGARAPRLLTESSVRAMRSPPSYVSAQRVAPTRYYGFGVWVLREGGAENWSHSGSQPGLQTLALRTSRGWAWVVAFNSRPKSESRQAFFADFDRALWRAARATSVWPTTEIKLD
ncbi:MAG: serine hydrolase domain-containing protein, partial [Pseudomonadota bacterium]